MEIEERIALVKRNAEELINEEELKTLFETKEQPTAYIGFEPSGLVHLGWALVAAKIRDLCDAGIKVIVFWADWHAFINDKLGGDLDNIRTCARYMEDCFIALGVPRDKVEFRYASELVSDPRYWEKVINVGKASTMARVKKSMAIMGRSEDEAELDSSKVIYPLMQASDIFMLDVDIAYGGLDQRRIHMLARDVADKLGWKKVIALHTPLLPGLDGGNRMDPAAAKMSKSNPNSSLKIHDSPDDIRKKMGKAFCPMEKENEDINPVLMICKTIIFPKIGRLDIDRPEKFGGPVSYASYGELTEAYFGGKLHPMDLKKGAAEGIIKCFDPVQSYFGEHPENLNEILRVLKELGKL